MAIKGAKTIEEYKKLQKIQTWIDRNFYEGAVTWVFDGDTAIKVTDKTGDSMVVQLADME